MKFPVLKPLANDMHVQGYSCGHWDWTHVDSLHPLLGKILSKATVYASF